MLPLLPVLVSSLGVGVTRRLSQGGVQKTPKYVYRLRWTHATRNGIIREYDTTRLVYLAFPVLTGLLPSRVPSPGFLFLVCGPCG